MNDMILLSMDIPSYILLIFAFLYFIDVSINLYKFYLENKLRKLRGDNEKR